MVSDVRCEFCGGPLSEDEDECPWCGREPGSEQESEDQPIQRNTLYIIIICVLVLTFGILFATQDMYVHPPYIDTSISLSSPDVTDRMIDEVVHWDVTTTALKITPKDEPVSWSGLYIRIYDADGHALHRHLDIREYDVRELDDGLDASVDIQAWYIKKSSDADKLEVHDLFRITGLTEDYDGCRIEIRYDDLSFGWIDLPDPFPE